MKTLPKFLLRCSLVAFAPVAANAAGTYYTGNYQSPQTRYANPQTYAQRTNAVGANTANNGYVRTGYNTGYANNAGYSAYASTRPMTATRTTQVRPANQASAQNVATVAAQEKNGFWLDAGISRQVAMWQFEMKESASILHYDNIDWNVLDINAGYDFNLGNTEMQIKAGFQYGIQSGESSMIDDDITNGGYLVTTWCTGLDADGKCQGFIGDQIGHVLSIGSSKGGSMMGFNVGLGLTDIFQWGNVKITPSIGFRYFSYKLETKKNYGLSVDTAACFTVDGSDEIQCDPAIVIEYDNGTQQIIWRDDVTGKMEISSTGAKVVDTGGTYYYQQPGTSHSYEVEWSGPYFALDMDYDINQYNAVNGHVELGLPGYTATGDQPYRFDWAHPKSVEDKAGIGGAFHFGLGANWMTAITDTVSMSVGVTYDYYTVSDADAKTYLNPGYYNDVYNMLLTEWAKKYPTDTEKYMLGQMDGVRGDPTALNIKEIEATCPGWVCSSDGEIESFYKSLGVRVGLQARF